MTSIRTILSLVAAEDLHLEQLDVNTTFSPWGFGGRDIYATTTRIRGKREGGTSVQVEEELVWLKTGSKVVVSKI